MSEMSERTARKPLREYCVQIWSRIKHQKIQLLFWAIVLVLIGARAYKAHTTGILHDEYWTVRDFCETVQSPMTVYTSTNNHVLNSLSIFLMQKLAGNYDHYIRIHTVLWGAVFCLSVGWILCKTIHSPVLRILFAGIVLLNWFIFDLSYLARGYAMAMGAVFLGVGVCIHCLSQTSQRRIDGWPIIILFIMMNAVAMGSMLSALSIVASLNLLYMGLVLLRSKADKTLKTAIIKLSVLIAGSGLSLLGIYGRILPEVRKFSKVFSKEPFFNYMKKITWEPFVKYHAMYPEQMKTDEKIFLITLVCVGLCLVIGAILLLWRIKSNPRKFFFQISAPAFILILTAAVFLMKVVQYKLLGMSLGMPRNSVFFVALLLISGGICVDLAVRSLSGMKLVYVPAICACSAVLCLFAYANRPSLKAVDIRPYDWGKQSAIGPLIRHLNAIDSQEMWDIQLSPYADCLRGPIVYYEKCGYHVRRAKTRKTEPFDVLVVREHKPQPNTVYIKYQDFIGTHVCVIANPEKFKDKRVVYQASPVDQVNNQ
jgi:hypothetical protein